VDEDKSIVDQIIAGQPQAEEVIDPEFLQDFIVEVREHLETIETNVLNLERNPADTENIHSLFRSFHTIKGLAGFVNLELIRELAHQTETLLDSCRKGITVVNKTVIELILKSTDFVKQIIEQIDLHYNQEFKEKVAEHLGVLGQRDWETVSAVVEANPNNEVNTVATIATVTEQKIENETPNLQSEDSETDKSQQSELPSKPAVIPPAPKVSTPVTEPKVANSNAGNNDFIRIPTSKVDNLVDMMGELLIIQSLIEEEVSKYYQSDDSLANKFTRMERITKDIQYLSMSLRMVSLKSTFQKINRIARDAINELQKNIEFVMEGEETEIDRSVAERLLEPLLHMVKNSISHGIEAETERISKGKPARGLVKISAYSKRGNVYIEVADDGKGLSLEKIYQKALEKKIIDPNINYSEDEIVNFIFLPGFSTAEKVDNISGRGVGLDVVRTEISRNGGKVEIDNRPGEGCRFILKIPINLAAMNGTILEIIGNHYIVPTLYIKQILQPDPSQWINVKGNRSMVRVRDNIVPLIPINKIFGIKETEIEPPELIICMKPNTLKQSMWWKRQPE